MKADKFNRLVSFFAWLAVVAVILFGMLQFVERMGGHVVLW